MVKSIHIRVCIKMSILPSKRLFYLLYHSTLQYTLHLNLCYSLLHLNILFYSLFTIYLRGRECEEREKLKKVIKRVNNCLLEERYNKI